MLPQLILLDAFFYFIFFSLLFLSVLNDRTGPSAGPLAHIAYSIPTLSTLWKEMGINEKERGLPVLDTDILKTFFSRSL